MVSSGGTKRKTSQKRSSANIVRHGASVPSGPVVVSRSNDTPNRKPVTLRKTTSTT
jgi:hypothetical protein